MGGNDRVLGEAPLQRLIFLIAQGVVFQADGLVGRIIQLDPVAQLAVLVGQSGEGGGHNLVDNHRSVADAAVHAVLLCARLGVFVAGADIADLLPSAVRQQRPRGIAA